MVGCGYHLCLGEHRVQMVVPKSSGGVVPIQYSRLRSFGDSITTSSPFLPLLSPEHIWLPWSIFISVSLHIVPLISISIANAAWTPGKRLHFSFPPVALTFTSQPVHSYSQSVVVLECHLPGASFLEVLA